MTSFAGDTVKNRPAFLYSKHSEAQDYREYAIDELYRSKCQSTGAESFRKLYPTGLHFLYAINTFWFYHDLWIQTDEWRKKINRKKHWEMAQLFDEAVTACELKHSMGADIDKIRMYDKPDWYLLEVSRDTFKSTICRAGLVRVMGIHPDWTNAYIRSIMDDASDGLQQIADILVFNKTLHQFFPQLKVDPKTVRKYRQKYNKKSISLINLQAYNPEDVELYALKTEFTVEANLEAVGLDQSITGSHGNGIQLFDDVVTEKNCHSIPTQNKLAGRLAEMKNVATFESVHVWAQTPYEDFDVFQRQKNILQQSQKDEEKFNPKVQIYRQYKQPLLQKDGYTFEELFDFVLHPKNQAERTIGEDSIVFPERHTPRNIREKYRQSPSPRFFLSQYGLIISGKHENVFKEEWLTYYGDNTAVGREPQRAEMTVYEIIDPSDSNDPNHDSVGILVVGLDKRNNSWILEAIQGRYTDKQLMDLIVSIDTMYHPDYRYMETFKPGNRYRDMIQQILNASKHRISIMSIKGETSAGAKMTRIESIGFLFESRKVYIQERHKDFIHPYLNYRHPPPAGLELHLLDCMGYYREKIYPIIEQQKELPIQKYSSMTVSERAELEIKYIRQEIVKSLQGKSTPCLRCGKINPMIADRCYHCGGVLYIPRESSVDETVYAYGLSN